MITKAVKEMGRLDVIVNNAGVTRHAHIMDLDEQDWDRMFRVNAKGVFFCMQRAAKAMIAQGSGRIINIASIAGRGYYGTSNCAYAGTKGAVLAMTYVAAHQLGPNNINVNAICPGVTYTSIVEGLLSARSTERGVTVEELKAEVGKSIPIQRGNDPEDIAAMAVFLAGPGARNITGQGFNVDGGLINS
jgi:NAD(P)-dependent dehydrogenase (short-subunit alcohol dehydrogenase family)